MARVQFWARQSSNPFIARVSWYPIFSISMDLHPFCHDVVAFFLSSQCETTTFTLGRSCAYSFSTHSLFVCVSGLVRCVMAKTRHYAPCILLGAYNFEITCHWT